MKKNNRLRWISLITVAILATSCLSGCIGPLSLIGCASLFEDGTYEIESDAPASVATYSNEKYVYNTLDETHRKVYDELYQGIVDMDDSIYVSTEDDQVLTTVTEAIAADHGDLFYIDGNYSYTNYGLITSWGFEVTPSYTMSKAERDSTQARIEEVANSWLAEVPPDANDYQKSKWVYETLINRVDYNGDAPNNQNIISVFLNGQTVCQGYSCAATYLFDKLGIQCFTVPGATNEGLHAWNCVKLDGQYYFMDITWGNSEYGGSSNSKEISYAMLNITTEDILKTHSLDAPFVVPDCVAIDDNYYYQEGLYFDTFQKEKMGMILHNGYVTDTDVSIKCANQETYDQMRDYFLTKGHFQDYCAGLPRINYVEYPDERIILYKFT